MNRQEFEKLDFIKNFIENFDVSHTNLGGYYFNKDKQPCYYLNGALWAFEFQQKKIDSVLDSVLGYVNNYVIDGNIADEIEEILK